MEGLPRTESSGARGVAAAASAGAQSAARTPTLAVVAAVNDAEVLRTNLAQSEALRSGVPLLEEWGHSAASAAYNAGLARTGADVVVFAHQDVYLPTGWTERLLREIRRIEEVDPGWAVVGLIGCDPSGGTVGRVYSSGLGKEVGNAIDRPVRAVSIDEMVIVLRTASGVRFDDGLRGFHLYGTDVLQSALAAGHGAWVVEAPAVHNSNPVRFLDGSYVRAYRHLQRKWRDRLPIHNLITPITRWGWPLASRRLRTFAKLRLRLARPRGAREPDGRLLAERIGYDARDDRRVGP